MTTIDDDVREVLAMRAKRDLAGVKYARRVRELLQSGKYTQVTLAKQLRVSQAAVSKMVKAVADVPEGFHGATPYEIAQQYAAGELTREQVLDELARFPYDQHPSVDDLLDDLVVVPEGAHTFAEVGRALNDGLIDAALYDAVLDAKP
ncbi:hypothetical protein [Isoptericola rhizosphaerae]|uniref:hypothetical protein n=1 Tax=Isoptericola rhizosphaerae TaxID=3377837 RepID=UPI00383A5A9A